MQQNNNYYNYQDELENELCINLKNIRKAIHSRRLTLLITFLSVLTFFILLTFILPKKYLVEADLYIDKANTSNLTEINPYFIEEYGGKGSSSLLGGGNALANEIELISSPLVMENVIHENNIRFKKAFGIFTTKKTGKYLTTDKFLKTVHIENKKGTNVLSIAYKSKKKELAYNVVNSIILNYIELHKQIHSDKAKADIKIIEDEYNRAKLNLSQKVNNVSGMPATSLSGNGGIAAMSAFSTSARKALANIQGQFIAGEKSRLETQEEAQKVAELSSKLQWARLVEEMSDSSKVLVIKEPKLLKEYEQASPKLFIQIILGIVFGIFASIIVLTHKEIHDKKLAYSMLGNEVIYDIKKELNKFKSILVSNNNNKIGFICFEEISPELLEQVKTFKNIILIQADISEKFKSNLDDADKLVLFEKIKQTDSETYKLIKNIIKDQKKEILTEILL